jgi:hypothetical protein
LNAKANRLTWLNGFIPIQCSGAIRITTAKRRIPRAGYFIGSVLPAQRPTIDCGGAIIGNSDGALKATTPFVDHRVAAGCSLSIYRKTQAQPNGHPKKFSYRKFHLIFSEQGC